VSPVVVVAFAPAVHFCSPTISSVEEPGVERTDSHGKSHDLLLQLSDVRIRLCLELDLLGDITNFIFDGTKLGVIRQPRDDLETTRASTCGDRRVDIGAVVRGQIIPNKNTIVISHGNAIDLDVAKNIILTEISKHIVGRTNVPYAPNPPSRMFHATIYICRKGRIPRLNCKKDGELLAMTVVAIFPHPKQLQHPPLFSVAFLNCHPKLVNINEHPPRHLRDAKGGSSVPEAEDVMLNRLSLCLIGLNRSDLCRDIQPLEALGDLLT
jgi:hypothetical protein